MTIALDIALLLPPTAQQIAQQLNEQLDQLENGGFLFDHSHHPHITLGQHFVSEDQICEISSCLEQILPNHQPLKLHVTGAHTGGTAQVLTVEPQEPLQHLHEALMDAMTTFEVQTGSPESFQTDGAPPRLADISWVTNFRNRSSYTRYLPHITIGIGTQPLTIAPFRFTARELAICRLGRFCTCRKQLACWTL
ncbi:MAG: hypothetical protein CL484_12390 [Acidobacteria bacterium]|nr:hypothetical protein [Acidobacteriota bacterium]